MYLLGPHACQPGYLCQRQFLSVEASFWWELLYIGLRPNGMTLSRCSISLWHASGQLLDGHQAMGSSGQFGTVTFVIKTRHATTFLLLAA